MNLSCFVELVSLPLGQVGSGPSEVMDRPKKVMKKLNAQGCAVEPRAVGRKRPAAPGYLLLPSSWLGPNWASATFRGSTQWSRPGHA